MPRKLTRIPSKIILPFNYIVRVVQVPPQHEYLLDKDSGQFLDGCWSPDERRIAINKSLPAKRKRWLLVHEFGHSFLDWQHECADNGIIKNL